jgi:hypothetical protein
MFAIRNNLRSVNGENGTTVFDVQNGQVITLDVVGSFIWQSMKDGDSFIDIVTKLSQITETDPRVVERDTWEFIENLTNKGFMARR